MEIVAHGLWASAAGFAGRRAGYKVNVLWLAFWGMFPDILAFGPMVAAASGCGCEGNSTMAGFRTRDSACRFTRWGTAW